MKGSSPGFITGMDPTSDVAVHSSLGRGLRPGCMTCAQAPKFRRRRPSRGRYQWVGLGHIRPYSRGPAFHVSPCEYVSWVTRIYAGKDIPYTVGVRTLECHIQKSEGPA